MRKELNRAIEFRKEGMQIKSNEILVKLVHAFLEDAVIHYHCAWSFDILGEESQVAPFYEKAIQLGLSG